jgi:hypothetical protein
LQTGLLLQFAQRVVLWKQEKRDLITDSLLAMAAAISNDCAKQIAEVLEPTKTAPQ